LSHEGASLQQLDFRVGGFLGVEFFLEVNACAWHGLFFYMFKTYINPELGFMRIL
jgi:hypothetical protein